MIPEKQDENSMPTYQTKEKLHVHKLGIKIKVFMIICLKSTV